MLPILDASGGGFVVRSSKKGQERTPRARPVLHPRRGVLGALGEEIMHLRWLAVVSLILVVAGLVVTIPIPAPAGEVSTTSRYTVLAPIRHGNLEVFPVVANSTHDTKEFLTLDEGLRSGEVVVSESGSLTPLIRPRHGEGTVRPRGGAQVNQLVLVNNAKRPLILLAGEIVTGGKQDRVIG